jgi:hypothetical protein
MNARLLPWGLMLVAGSLAVAARGEDAKIEQVKITELADKEEQDFKALADARASGPIEIAAIEPLSTKKGSFMVTGLDAAAGHRGILTHLHGGKQTAFVVAWVVDEPTALLLSKKMALNVAGDIESIEVKKGIKEYNSLELVAGELSPTPAPKKYAKDIEHYRAMTVWLKDVKMR